MSYPSMLEKVSKIIDNLNNDLIHHKKQLSKYKNAHTILSRSQLFLNSLSIATGSSTAVTLASGVGIPLGVILSSITACSAGLGVFSNLLDQRMLKKVHKHYQLLVLLRTLDLRLFSNYLIHDELSPEVFKNIIEMMEKFHQQKDLIETKSLFMAKNINELAQDFRHALNGKTNNININNNKELI